MSYRIVLLPFCVVFAIICVVVIVAATPLLVLLGRDQREAP